MGREIAAFVKKSTPIGLIIASSVIVGGTVFDIGPAIPAQQVSQAVGEISIPLSRVPVLNKVTNNETIDNTQINDYVDLMNQLVGHSELSSEERLFMLGFSGETKNVNDRMKYIILKQLQE